MKFRLSVVLALCAAAAAAAPFKAQYNSTGRLLVSFSPGLDAAQRRKAAEALGYSFVEDIPQMNAALVETSNRLVLQSVPQDARIASVEDDSPRLWIKSATPAPNIFPLLGTATRAAKGREKRAQSRPVNDPRFPWNILRVDAREAWKTGAGRGVSVAIIDTGIDCSHPDLSCRYENGINIVTPESSPQDDNNPGHGTHVSGTVAGQGISGGVYGVAPLVTLMPVKALNGDGAGRPSDIAKGIIWAADHGAQVISMSLGSPEPSPGLQRAVDYALRRQVVVVAAAGNDGPAQNTIGYPAAFPGVIAVAASDERDHVASFSSRGRGVTFIAPGARILSTVPGGYMFLDGTSMATPHVAALAALAIERGASGPAGVASALARASKKLCPDSRCSPATEEGRGMIDAAKIKP